MEMRICLTKLQSQIVWLANIKLILIKVSLGGINLIVNKQVCAKMQLWFKKFSLI